MFSFHQSNISLSTHTHNPKKIKLRDLTKYSSGPQMNNKFQCFIFLLCKAFPSLYSIAGKAIIISPWPLHFSVYRPVFLQGAVKSECYFLVCNKLKLYSKKIKPKS